MKPKCLETRRQGHLVKRTYLKPNGRRVKTMEIPWALWLPVRSAALKRLDGYLRAEAARDRIEEVKRLLAEGHKQEYIAEVTGLGQGRVSQINLSMKKETK